jgi:hypothetical protein
VEQCISKCYRNSYSIAIRSSEAKEKKAETCKMACYADNDNEDADDDNENADEYEGSGLSPAELKLYADAEAERQKELKEEAEMQKKIEQKWAAEADHPLGRPDPETAAL